VTAAHRRQHYPLDARCRIPILRVVPKLPSRPSPARTPRAVAEHQARQDRAAAALRENLRKRKEQARARKTADASAPSKEQD